MTHAVAASPNSIEPAALPSFWEYEAPREWQCIDFLSDLHLQESTPRTFTTFEAHLRDTPADAVFILGDLFEAWVGDDARFEGFEQRCAAVLAQASRGKHLAFMVGNRDFLVGQALLRDCDITALPDPTVLTAFGQRVLLSHGDALCLEDRDYQRFRAEVRQPGWQQAFLAKPLQERRLLARHIRDASQQRKQHQTKEDWADLDRAATLSWMREAQAPVLVHGHTHRPAHEQLAPGFERWVLSDWEQDHPPLRADVLRLSHSGFQRVLPSSASDLK